MGAPREAAESPVMQGENEEIAYRFDFTSWGAPTSPTVTLVRIADDTDLSATHLTGTASVNGNTVTTPTVADLAAGYSYRLTCSVTIGGQVMSAYAMIYGEE